MPIIQIKALPQKPEIEISKVIKAITTEVSKSTNIPLSNLWVTWETLAEHHYIEGIETTSVQPFNSHPPLINIISYVGKPAKLQEAILTSVGRTVTKELQIDPGNCFIVYSEVKAGHVYDGGEVVKEMS
jgi:phenylpyruvate tautomerase PptA (4-oxalocrotonate tautomerase family)